MLNEVFSSFMVLLNMFMFRSVLNTGIKVEFYLFENGLLSLRCFLRFVTSAEGLISGKLLPCNT